MNQICRLIHIKEKNDISYPSNIMPQRMTLHNLLRLVPIDNSFQTVESSSTHDVTNAFLFNAESLDLVVDVEE